MADFKENMYRRLRSARQWLKRAEESFDKDRDIRAELDLMLAQAELQHAKEANRTRHWRYRYSLLTQGAAVGLAMMIAAVGFGSTYWWFNRHPTSNYQAPAGVNEQIVLPQPPASLAGRHEQPKTAAAAPEAKFKPSEAPAAVQSEHQQKTTAAESRAKSYDEPYQYEKEKQVVLPPDEMQKLVRAAGKSLRGQ